MAADVSKLVAYAITSGADDEVAASKVGPYAVTGGFPVEAATVSKLDAPVITGGFPIGFETVSKIGPYAITGGFPVNAASVSKFYAYAITVEGAWPPVTAVGLASAEVDEAFPIGVIKPPPVVDQCAPPEPRFLSDGLVAEAPGQYTANQNAIVDPVTGYIWTTTLFQPLFTPGHIETRVTSDLTQSQIASFSNLVSGDPAFIYGLIYVPTGATGREMWVHGAWANDFFWIYNADSLTYVGFFDLGYRGTARMERAQYNPVLEKVLTVGYGGFCHVIDPLTRTEDVADAFRIDNTASGCPFIAVTPDYMIVITGPITYLNIDDWSVDRVLSTGFSALAWAGYEYDSQRERLLHVSMGGFGAYEMLDIESGVITSHTVSLAAAADEGSSTDVWTMAYSPYNDRYMFLGRSTASKMSTLHTVNPDTLLTEHSYTYEMYAGLSFVNPILIPRGVPNYLLVRDIEELKRYYMGPCNAVEEPLADIIRRANGGLIVTPPTQDVREEDCEEGEDCKEDKLRDEMNARIHGTDAKSRLEMEMAKMTEFVNCGRKQPGAPGHSISAALRYLLCKKP